MDFLAIPFELREDYLSRAESMRDSIAFSLGLLLSTRVGSMTFLPKYGCDIWQMEYGDLDAVNKATIRGTLRNAISTYEKRLSDISVTFTTVRGPVPHAIGVNVKVTGLYRENGEEKKFEGVFFLGS
jgi:phage baseplate assembly protein W